MRGRVLVAFACLTGCESSWFNALPIGTTETRIAVVHARTPATWVSNADLPLEASIAAGTRVVVAEYVLSASELGLSLEAPLPPGPRTCDLLRPDRVFAGVVGEDELVPSALENEDRDVLVPDRVGRCTECAKFNWRSVSFPVGTREDLNIAAADWISSDAIVVAAYEDGLYLAKRESTVQLQNCVDAAATGVVSAGSGRVWVAELGGVVRLLEVDVAKERCTRLATVTASVTHARTFRAPMVRDGDSAWVLTPDGTLSKLSEGGVERTLRFPLHRRDQVEGESLRASMFAYDGGVAGSTGAREIFVTTATTALLRPIEGHPDDFISASAFIPSLGIVASSSFGQVWHSRDSGEHWTFVPVPREWNPGVVRAFVPLGDGFVASISGARIVQYSQSSGFCPPQELVPFSEHESEVILHQGRDFVIPDLDKSAGLTPKVIWATGGQ